MHMHTSTSKIKPGANEIKWIVLFEKQNHKTNIFYSKSI